MDFLLKHTLIDSTLKFDIWKCNFAFFLTGWDIYAQNTHANFVVLWNFEHYAMKLKLTVWFLWRQSRGYFRVNSSDNSYTV